MYRAAQGHDGLAEFERRQKKPGGKAAAAFKKAGFLGTAGAAVDGDDAGGGCGNGGGQEETRWDNIQGRFRVFFPSRQTVSVSKGGFDYAGTVCFWSKWWKDPSFPKALVRDCKSVRAETLMHNKVAPLHGCEEFAMLNRGWLDIICTPSTDATIG